MVDNLDTRKIRSMTDEQVLNAIEDNREEMWQLRLDHATGELANPNLLTLNRRNLAKLKTVLHERHLATQVTDKGSNNNG